MFKVSWLKDLTEQELIDALGTCKKWSTIKRVFLHTSTLGGSFEEKFKDFDEALHFCKWNFGENSNDRCNYQVHFCNKLNEITESLLVMSTVLMDTIE